MRHIFIFVASFVFSAQTIVFAMEPKQPTKSMLTWEEVIKRAEQEEFSPEIESFFSNENEFNILFFNMEDFFGPQTELIRKLNLDLKFAEKLKDKKLDPKVRENVAKKLFLYSELCFFQIRAPVLRKQLETMEGEILQLKERLHHPDLLNQD